MTVSRAERSATGPQHCGDSAHLNPCLMCSRFVRGLLITCTGRMPR